HLRGYRVVGSELYGVARSFLCRDDLTLSILKPDEPPRRAGEPLRSRSGERYEPTVQPTDPGEQRAQIEPGSGRSHGSFSEYEAPAAALPDFARAVYVSASGCHPSTASSSRAVTLATATGLSVFARLYVLCSFWPRVTRGAQARSRNSHLSVDATAR